MRALITGGYGFVGRHLAHHLVSCGDDVAVTYLPAEKDTPADSLRVALPRQVQTLALDVTKKPMVDEVVKLLKPDAIYHLAARTFVPHAETEFEEVMTINCFGTVNVLEAIKNYSPETKFLYVSSAEVYGEPRPGSLPLTELTAPRPLSAYGVTKAAADLATFKFASRDGIEAIRVRPFPHIGPGQSDQFAISSFARQVAEIRLKRRDPVIRVGNLDVKRDYSDVADIVRGYREVLLNGKRSDVYNLCSGQSVGIGDLLQKLIKVAEVEATVEVDPERVRAVDIPELYGSYQKAQKEFGWKPRIQLEDTLQSLFAFWIETLDSLKK